jgi:hypothetical protein
LIRRGGSEERDYNGEENDDKGDKDPGPQSGLALVAPFHRVAIKAHHVARELNI